MEFIKKGNKFSDAEKSFQSNYPPSNMPVDTFDHPHIICQVTEAGHADTLLSSEAVLFIHYSQKNKDSASKDLIPSQPPIGLTAPNDKQAKDTTTKQSKCVPKRIITNEIVQKIVKYNQCGLSSKKTAELLGITQAQICYRLRRYRKFGILTADQSHKRRQKQAQRQVEIDKVYQLMLAMLQYNPLMKLRQVWLQLELHGFWIPKGTIYLLMHGPVVAVCVLSNEESKSPQLDNSTPYDPTIIDLVKNSMTTSLDDIVFVSYYKLGYSYQFFGEKSSHPVANKKSDICGFFVGAFLVVSSSGIHLYQTNVTYHKSYGYGASVQAMLSAWKDTNKKHKVFLSAHADHKEETVKDIQDAGHQVEIYPANHADPHLGDVLFYNIGSLLRKHNPTSFKQVESLITNQEALFPTTTVKALHSVIVSYANDSKKLNKDSRLPPRHSPLFIPTSVITEQQYDQLNAAAKKCPLLSHSASSSGSNLTSHNGGTDSHSTAPVNL
ncbi:hypothetical protein DSO57_1038472 [Entomophthora muscae]|uniref:Uncharacterized protein n=1 Tax=Entomophthora muscae TaxID=34485 RepID=A0ACC2T9P3_9FUNG|nr:hypothetical protein DSO57_1038472 [Entomophthora muscae]